MKGFLSVAASLIFAGVFFIGFYAVADASVIAPTDFFARVLDVGGQLGGMSQLGKVSAIILLIVASMKVTFLNELIWQKLGEAKVWVAPALGLIGGILGLGAGDVPLDAARVFAYITAGVGAVALHELLDSVKAIPGIGSVYVNLISIVQSWLGGPVKQK